MQIINKFIAILFILILGYFSPVAANQASLDRGQAEYLDKSKITLKIKENPADSIVRVASLGLIQQLNTDPLSKIEALKNKKGLTIKKIIKDDQNSNQAQISNNLLKAFSLNQATSQSPKEKHLAKIAERKAKSAKLKAKYGLNRIYEIECDTEELCAELLNDLKEDTEIEYAEFEVLYEKNGAAINDPYYNSNGEFWENSFPELWGVKDIKADEAWQYSQGEGVVVAVIDTGLNYNHPDILENVWVNPSLVDDVNNDGEINYLDIDTNNNGRIDDEELIDEYIGYTHVQENSLGIEYNQFNPRDDNGHGSHVSGTIAAVGDNGIGIVGVAPKAKISTYKVLDDEGIADSVDTIQAVIKAAEQGADVINASYGSPFADELAEDAYNFARDLGVVVVSSAGNSANDLPNFPSAYESNIAVAAHDYYRNESLFTNFGNYVDFIAPGSDILSLSPNEYVVNSPNDLEDNYNVYSGTSMASPHVAGLVALLKSKRPDLNPSDVKDFLTANTRDEINYLARGEAFSYITNFNSRNYMDLPLYRRAIRTGNIDAYSLVTSPFDFAPNVKFSIKRKSPLLTSKEPDVWDSQERSVDILRGKVDLNIDLFGMNIGSYLISYENADAPKVDLGRNFIDFGTPTRMVNKITYEDFDTTELEDGFYIFSFLVTPMNSPEFFVKRIVKVDNSELKPNDYISTEWNYDEQTTGDTNGEAYININFDEYKNIDLENEFNYINPLWINSINYFKDLNFIDKNSILAAIYGFFTQKGITFTFISGNENNLFEVRKYGLVSNAIYLTREYDPSIDSYSGTLELLIEDVYGLRFSKFTLNYNKVPPGSPSLNIPNREYIEFTEAGTILSDIEIIDLDLPNDSHSVRILESTSKGPDGTSLSSYFRVENQQLIANKRLPAAQNFSNGAFELSFEVEDSTANKSEFSFPFTLLDNGEDNGSKPSISLDNVDLEELTPANTLVANFIITDPDLPNDEHIIYNSEVGILGPDGTDMSTYFKVEGKQLFTAKPIPTRIDFIDNVEYPNWNFQININVVDSTGNTTNLGQEIFLNKNYDGFILKPENRYVEELSQPGTVVSDFTVIDNVFPDSEYTVSLKSYRIGPDGTPFSEYFKFENKQLITVKELPSIKDYERIRIGFTVIDEFGNTRIDRYYSFILVDNDTDDELNQISTSSKWNMDIDTDLIDSVSSKRKYQSDIDFYSPDGSSRTNYPTSLSAFNLDSSFASKKDITSFSLNASTSEESNINPSYEATKFEISNSLSKGFMKQIKDIIFHAEDLKNFDIKFPILQKAQLLELPGGRSIINFIGSSSVSTFIARKEELAPELITGSITDTYKLVNSVRPVINSSFVKVNGDQLEIEFDMTDKTILQDGSEADLANGRFTLNFDLESLKNDFIKASSLNTNNSAPVDISLIDGNQINENTRTGSIVSRLFASEEKDIFDKVNFELIPSQNSDKFKIQGNLLLSNTIFDFESYPEGQAFETITVTATDSAGNAYTKDLVIEIVDLENEGTNSAKGFMSLSGNTVPENSFIDNYIIGFLKVEQGDLNSLSYKYSLVSNNQDLFSVSETGTLRALQKLDFEKQSVYRVRVRATEPSGNYLESSFIINVTDDFSDNEPTEDEPEPESEAPEEDEPEPESKAPEEDEPEPESEAPEEDSSPDEYQKFIRGNDFVLDTSFASQISKSSLTNPSSNALVKFKTISPIPDLNIRVLNKVRNFVSVQENNGSYDLVLNRKLRKKFRKRRFLKLRLAVTSPDNSTIIRRFKIRLVRKARAQ